MKIEPEGIYYRSDLEAYLRTIKIGKRSIPHTHPTIIQYENRGIIPTPQRLPNGSRVYTGKMVLEIADIIYKRERGEQ